MREMNGNTLPVLSRKDAEALIAQGHKLFILDDFVIKADAWIPYHPGGDKSILHMIGRDATDEVTALVLPRVYSRAPSSCPDATEHAPVDLHSIEAKYRMSRHRIGTVQGRWENFVPPIQGGTFRLHSDSGRDAYRHADTASSPASSRRSSVSVSDNSDAVSSMHRKSRTTGKASRSSSLSSVPSTRTEDDAMSHLDFVTKQKISLDLATYPPLDHATQDAIVAAYRRLDDRLRAQGLYGCNYRAYAIEVSRYTMLFAVMLLFLHWGWYAVSAVLSLESSSLADFMGGLSLCWWKKSHNIHHIVTNSPEHDPDVEYLPFLAVSHRFLAVCDLPTTTV
ncbi:Fatty acid desaturase [Colletotrichum asianum]